MTTPELAHYLLDAVWRKNLPQVRQLISQGADQAVKNISPDPLLHHAIKTGDLDTVRCIVECLGGRINFEDKDLQLQTPLQMVEKNKMDYLDIQKYLLGILMQNSDNSIRASQIAQMDNTPTLYEVIFESKTFNSIETPLMLAAIEDDDNKDNIEKVKSLVESGIDLNFMNQLYQSARYAAIYNNFKILKYLIDKGAGTTYSGSIQDLFHAVIYQEFYSDYAPPQNEMIEVMDYMLERGVKGIDSRDSIGATPILYAASFGHSDFNDRIEVLEYLIEKGCSLDSKDYYGRGIMYYATSDYAFLADIAYLVKKGVDINPKTVRNMTPLDLATKSRSIGFLCASPKTEINLENHDLKKRLIKSINDKNIFASFDAAFMEEYDGDSFFPLVITCFNVLRAFNRFKGRSEEDKEFTKNLSKQLLVQSIKGLYYFDDEESLNDHEDIDKGSLSDYKDIDPKYAEIALYLIINKELNYLSDMGSTNHESEVLTNELADILPEVINENILLDASQMSISEGFKSVLSLRKVITVFKTKDQNVSNAVEQLKNQIDLKMPEYNEVIKSFLKPIKTLSEYKKEFKKLPDHNGDKVQEFREEKKKILDEIPGFKATHAVDLMYLKSLWEDILTLIDSYNLEKQIVSKESEEIKILIKDAIKALQEENCDTIQSFFGSNAKKIEKLDIEGFNSDFCEGLGTLRPSIFEDLISHFEEGELMKSFWGIPIWIINSNDLGAKRKVFQEFADANKKAKTILHEVSSNISTRTDWKDSYYAHAMLVDTASIGYIEDLDSSS